ncbi:pentatricopeptide repeat-containing protein At3g22670, mitochondrial-like isoform X2 [Aristolochia californica]|uniref:pentatricopeptide repeat-containing protein At3g22670, mitochondrial-like isoform X2 n=1 Tax=Aristolochia californica TaxID=171875 RepID=UPI0035E2F928
MLRRSTLLRIISQCGSEKQVKLWDGFTHQVNGAFFCLFNSLCRMPESPELPSWILFPQTEQSSVANSNDDFVLPYLVRSVSNGAHGQETCYADACSEVIDDGTNKISEILKASWFKSPEMVVHALDGSDLDISKSLVAKILKRFSNDWIPAFGFFSWASKQDKGFVSLITVSKIMRRFARADRWKDAVDTFHRIEDFGLRQDTAVMNILLDTLCKERSTEHAQDVFLELRGKAGRLCDADDVFKEMCTNGIAPNLTTYNTLITSACDHSQEDNALGLLKQMEESSCKPDLKTYAPLLKMCCKKKRMKTLQFLLNDMFRKDISIDLGTYTLLVQGLCSNGLPEHSYLFFEEMVLKGFLPRKHTYDMLVKELARKNLEKAKCKIQELMVQAETKNPLRAFIKPQAI